MVNTLVVSAIEKLVDSVVAESIVLIFFLILLVVGVMNLWILVFLFASLSMMINNPLTLLAAFLFGG